LSLAVSSSSSFGSIALLLLTCPSGAGLEGLVPSTRVQLVIFNRGHTNSGTPAMSVHHSCVTSHSCHEQSSQRDPCQSLPQSGPRTHQVLGSSMLKGCTGVKVKLSLPSAVSFVVAGSLLTRSWESRPLCLMRSGCNVKRGMRVFVFGWIRTIQIQVLAVVVVVSGMHPKSLGPQGKSWCPACGVG
jgi:hypothetical protein